MHQKRMGNTGIDNGKIPIQFKQRVSLCHIGLVKDHGSHLVNQPRLSLFQSVEKQQWEIK